MTCSAPALALASASVRTPSARSCASRSAMSIGEASSLRISSVVRTRSRALRMRFGGIDSRTADQITRRVLSSTCCIEFPSVEEMRRAFIEHDKGANPLIVLNEIRLECGVIAISIVAVGESHSPHAGKEPVTAKLLRPRVAASHSVEVPPPPSPLRTRAAERLSARRPHPLTSRKGSTPVFPRQSRQSLALNFVCRHRSGRQSRDHFQTLPAPLSHVSVSVSCPVGALP
jgi:hypothetical protein